jgi:hypothetical protein
VRTHPPLHLKPMHAWRSLPNVPNCASWPVMSSQHTSLHITMLSHTNTAAVPTAQHTLMAHMAHCARLAGPHLQLCQLAQHKEEGPTFLMGVPLTPRLLKLH